MRPLRLIYTLLLLLLTLLAIGACTSPMPQHPDQLQYAELHFQPPDVEKLVLSNGVRLYLKEDKELPLIQLTAMIGAGAMTTPQEKTGFNSLFGSTLRTGGADGWTPEALDEQLDLLAANLSASMGPYVTQMDLSLRSVDLDQGLEILSALLRRPAFAQDKLDHARLQAQESVRRQNDNPGAISRRLLMAALYPDHYLGFSPTLETLAAVSREDLVRFHQTYFAPNNLWLAISGDFDRQDLLAQLETQFGDWAESDVTEQVLPPIVRATSGAIQVVEKDLPQTTIVIGDLGLTKDDPDQYAVQIMNYILGGGGFNSRMMREIRSNRGLAYSAYSYFQTGRRFPGPFIAGTETKNSSVVPVIELTREIMADLRDIPVTEAELQLAKESKINSFVFGFENTHSVVGQQMRLDFYDYPDDYLSAYRDNLAAVTVEDVQRVAAKFINFDNQQMVLVGNSGDFLKSLEGFNLPVREVVLDESP